MCESSDLASVCIIIHMPLACFKGQLLEPPKNRITLNGKRDVKNIFSYFIME